CPTKPFCLPRLPAAPGACRSLPRSRARPRAQPAASPGVSNVSASPYPPFEYGPTSTRVTDPGSGLLPDFLFVRIRLPGALGELLSPAQQQCLSGGRGSCRAGGLRLGRSLALPTGALTMWDSVIASRPQLGLDVARDQVHREQVAHPADLGVLLELAQVGQGQALAQLLKALGGDLAVLHELRVAVEDRIGEQFAARDLDSELALQPEEEGQEVDRLGPQIALMS